MENQLLTANTIIYVGFNPVQKLGIFGINNNGYYQATANEIRAAIDARGNSVSPQCIELKTAYGVVRREVTK